MVLDTQWLQQYPVYDKYESCVPVYCLTPGAGRVIHRFFDSSPLSPDGQWLAVTRFPFEDKSPRAGDTAEVVVVNLASGQEKTIASTAAWGSQLGAQVQWGASAQQLFFNQMDIPGKPYGVCVDPESGEKHRLNGTVYHVSASGRSVVSPCLLRTGRTQLGYGVMVPQSLVPVNAGASAEDGVTVTNAVTGESRMITTVSDIVGRLEYLKQGRFSDGDFYLFHTKWSPDEQRIMLVLRWTPAEKRGWWFRKPKPASKKTMRKFVITIAADGLDPRIAVNDEQWARGGHHPNWCPDSQNVMMNLNANGDGLRFVRASIDGGTPELLHPTAEGSGHPSLHPTGRFLLTDAYPGEAAGYGDGTVPIRIIDLQSGNEKVIARILSRPDYVGPRKEMRVDAHPAWDSTGDFVVFNACPDGTRRVFLADVSGLVKNGF